MELKTGKADGTETVDSILAELLNSLGSNGMRELFDICNDVYITAEWPKDFTESTVIATEKKHGAQECVGFRTISLVSHASKIVLRIKRRALLARISVVLEEVKVLEME